MKSQYIADLKPGEQVTDSFGLLEVIPKVTKAGKGYLRLRFGDRTGQLAGNWWSPDMTVLPEADRIVKVQATVEEYEGEKQFNVRRMRPLNAEEAWDLKDFLPAGPDQTMQFELLRDRASLMREPLGTLCVTAISDSRFITAPAGVRVHHAFVGGLCHHVANLCRLADVVARQYVGGLASSLDTDMLIAGAIWHDIGKLDELELGVCSFRYTARGSLVGHVGLGLALLESIADLIGCDIDSKDAAHLAHIIASHHGTREHGALTLPATREAQVFHLLDMLDSRMGIYDNIDAEPVDAGGFTAFNSLIGTRAWRVNGVASAS